MLLVKDQKESSVTKYYKELYNLSIQRIQRWMFSKDKTEKLDGGEMTEGNKAEHLHQVMKQ